jgi:hypothetical protein
MKIPRRQSEILNIARSLGRASVEDLSRRFNASTQTIRKDLADSGLSIFLSKRISSPAGGGARRAEGDSVVIPAVLFVSRDRVPLWPYEPPPHAGRAIACGMAAVGKVPRCARDDNFGVIDAERRLEASMKKIVSSRAQRGTFARYSTRQSRSSRTKEGILAPPIEATCDRPTPAGEVVEQIVASGVPGGRQ